MSARSRIGSRGAALEPHHAPPQRHRDRCAGLPTVRTYSRRDPTWFSRAPARSRPHRTACGIWSLRSRSVSPARACACRLSLALSEVVVDVTLDDGFIDLVEEGFDLVLRVGELKNSSLVVRRLAPVRFVLCASPDYVKQHGVPREPADLLQPPRHPRRMAFQGPVSAPTTAICFMRDARGRRYRLRSD